MNLRVCNLNARNDLKPETTDRLLHGAFKVRYQVYHDEMVLIPENPERELCDDYDFIDQTTIFVALDGTEPVGTLRLTRFSERYELPMFKNFRDELENGLGIFEKMKNGRKFAEGSRFTVLKEYRHGKGLVPSVLTCMMHDQCVEDGVTDIVIVANPGQQRLYETAGFKAFGVKRDSLTGIESPAMHAEVKDGLGEFIKYLKSKLKGKDLIRISGGPGRITLEVKNL
jgi:N-acyl-L-homoserine lactone synthetase